MAPASKPLTQASFVIAGSGFAYGPGQALRDHLVSKGVGQLTTVFHPLGREDGSLHVVSRFRRGVLSGTKSIWLPSMPPLTYPFDLFIPPWPPRADAWFGFNVLTCLQGLAARKIGRASKVIYWCVDYVENRFGTTAATNLYEWLDGVCCRRATARFELSSRAAIARDRRHAGRTLAPARIVPMGAWTQRTPKTASDAWQRRRVVYLGHLVARQGVGTLIDAIAALNRRGARVTADIIGRGPLEEQLRQQAEGERLNDIITFHGFIEDHRDVEALLAQCSVAVAPYATNQESFTQFADPGKLKDYLAAGLPIVMTPVPPNAEELAASGAAVLVDATPASVAQAIETVLSSEREWTRRREAALATTRRYDWDVILGDALESLGFAQ